MQTIEILAPVKRNSGPEIWCSELTEFDESGLESIGQQEPQMNQFVEALR